MPAVEVHGLREAAKNLALIGKVGSTELYRAALREAGQVVSRRIKAATYSNFKKRTGAIRAGFGVRVAKALKGDELLSFVVQFPTTVGLRPTKKRRSKKSAAKPPPTTGVAFWWRYLEFGTKGRKTVKTADFIRKGKTAKGARQTKALARYGAAKSQGDIKERKWIRPAFGGSAAAAIDTFGASFRRRVETQVNNLSKT